MAVVEFIKDVINFLTNPQIFITLAAHRCCSVGHRATARSGGRRWRWSWASLGAVFLGLSMLDPNFALIVKKPDNIPIVAMLFLVGFFMWLSLHQAYENDDAHRRRRAAERRRATARRRRPGSGPTSSTPSCSAWSSA